MHMCNIRQCKLRVQMLTFLQLGPTAMTQDRTYLADCIPTLLPLSTFHSSTTSYSSAGTEGHRALQSLSPCKSTINLLYNIDVMDFVNTQPTNNDLLHELLAVQSKTGAHRIHNLRQLQRVPQTSAEVNTPTRACGQPAIHPSLKITAAVCKFCTCV